MLSTNYKLWIKYSSKFINKYINQDKTNKKEKWDDNNDLSDVKVLETSV